MRGRAPSFGDFKCAHCQAFVPSAHWISGVNNRNHCPYCLWSCHLDLYTAGDRLSACKAPMAPVGLTLKRSKNKYQPEARGELMLIHQCTWCKALSINRIAADDDAESVMAVFQDSLSSAEEMYARCQEHAVLMLQAEDREIVHARLYGMASESILSSWK